MSEHHFVNHQTPPPTFIAGDSVRDSVGSPTEGIDLSRRSFAKLAGSAVVLVCMPMSVFARGIIRDIYGDAPISQSRVSLEIPTLAENGNSVALLVSVDSPMNESDYIEELKIIAPENPEPLLATFTFGPGSGKAQVRTRIRLANSQAITAVARTNSGELYSVSKKTVITLAACVEPLL